MTTIQLNVQGMSCNGCAQSIERRLRTTAGVQDVSVNFQEAVAKITFDDTVTNLDMLAEVIESLGFEITSYNATA